VHTRERRGSMHYRTAYNGYACAFSPFHENRLAVATAQNFGIIGNGRQYVLEVRPFPRRDEIGPSFSCHGSSGSCRPLACPIGTSRVSLSLTLHLYDKLVFSTRR
jgi:hypothetical protein